MSRSSPRLRVLVTGLDGFTGLHLSRELTRHGHEVVALEDASGTKVDVRDRCGVERAVRRIAPDAVIHLAGVAFVAHDDVEEIYTTNVLGTRNILAALAEARKPLKSVVVASSASVYGEATELPISESAPIMPSNDYGVSKAAAELLVGVWGDALPIIVTRPFNYTGVGQSDQFLIPRIVRHFRDRRPRIDLGNVDVSRDFSDVRDIVKYYRLLMELAPGGTIVNLCSGIETSILEVVSLMRDLSGFDTVINSIDSLRRAREVRRVLGSSRKLRTLLPGIEPRPLRDTLEWMYQNGSSALAAAKARTHE